MDSVCLKMCGPVEAEAWLLYLEEFGIHAVLAHSSDGILTNLGSEPILTSVLLLRKDLPAALEALQKLEGEDALATEEDIANLKALLGK